jgi:hypothetical protein
LAAPGPLVRTELGSSWARCGDNLKPIFQILLAALIAPFVAIAVGGSLLILNWSLDAWAGHKFDQIRWGESEASVVDRMGKPDTVRRCGENLWWGDDAHFRGKNDGSCVTEVRYEYFLSAWAVGYSKDGRVVSKYHYFSE